MGEEGEPVRPRKRSQCLHENLTANLGYRTEDLQLARFKGRPGELSPKARFWLFAGWLLPSRFKCVYNQSFPFFLVLTTRCT